MKKTTLVVFSLAVAVLLGLTVYLTFFVPGSCPQQNFLLGQRHRMGPGMMGPGRMSTPGVFIDSEYEFLAHMIPHHEEAIFTANILHENTEREEMKRFAEVIISSQSDEIERMTTWLAAWYPEKEHTIDYQPMMRDLADLEGEELDKVFLEDMIPHHMEAVMMSQQLLSRGLAEHEEVASLAGDIRNNQRAEIHMMMNWMSKWYGNAPVAEISDGNTLMWVGLIALAVLILLAVWLISVVYPGLTVKASNVKSAKELLDIRYAKGEISREEYRNSRKNFEKR